MSAAKKINKSPGSRIPKLFSIKKIHSTTDYTMSDYIESYVAGFLLSLFSVIVIQVIGGSYLKAMTTGGNSFPLTFQGFMWVILGIGMGSLLFKNSRINEKLETFDIDCLPKDPHLILDSKEIAKILVKLKAFHNNTTAVFPLLVSMVLKKYQTNKSVEEASSMLNSQIEILQQRSDTEYNGLRYYSWLLPSIGFMGTVYGISEAVAVVGQSTPDDPDLLKSVAVSLAIAFDTTLLALIQSSILLFFMNKLESKEENVNVAIQERIVNQVINRLN